MVPIITIDEKEYVLAKDYKFVWYFGIVQDILLMCIGVWLVL